MASSFYYSQRTVRGYLTHEVVSALQKAIRRCQPELAVYWAVELDRSSSTGGMQVWNRLAIITSEDIGLAEPDLPATIAALFETWKQQRARNSAAHPERLMLVHAVLLLARARKSRMVDHAVHAMYTTNETLYEIPDEARDMHTAAGRRLRRGSDHWYEEAAVLVNQVDLDDPFEKMSYDLQYAEGLPTPLDHSRTRGRAVVVEEPPAVVDEELFG